MTMTKFQQLRRSGYSLIELLIVMFILAALLSVIVPQINFTKLEAANTATDYNLAGVDRYLKMYKALYGVYPAGFDTGFVSSDVAAAATTLALENYPVSNDFAAAVKGSSAAYVGAVEQALDFNLVQEINMDATVGVTSGDMTVAAMGTINAGPSPLTVSEAASLALAGIRTLNDGTTTVDFSTLVTTAVGNANASLATASGLTQIVVARVDSGFGLKSGTSLNGTLNGFTGGTVASIDGTLTTAIGQNCMLLVGPDVDWFNYYASPTYAANSAAAGIAYGVTASSVIGLANAPKSPLVTKANKGYYIAVFRTDNSVATAVNAPAATTTASFTPATLLSVFDAGNLRNLNP